MLRIYVDADACPVTPEVYRVAQRYGLGVAVVSNARMRVPDEPGIELVVVADGFDAAGVAAYAKYWGLPAETARRVKPG